jgi:hypothetical protein
MRIALILALVAGVGLVALGGLQAGDQKQVTLKGTILCAKCALKEAKKCQTAIQVKEGDKTVTYYFKDKGTAESYHEEVCGGERHQGTVTGTVTREGEKRFITPKKVEYAKK